MFNKLHNGNTEALPLIRKEKTIAITILVLVFYQKRWHGRRPATMLPCSEIHGQAVQLFCEVVDYSCVESKTFVLSADEDRPTVRLPFVVNLRRTVRVCVYFYDSLAETLPKFSLIKADPERPTSLWARLWYVTHSFAPQRGHVFLEHGRLGV